MALDLIQDTFVAALTNYSKFEGKSKVSTWLISILRNKIIDYYRKKKIETEPIENLLFKKNGMWNPEASVSGNLKHVLDTLEAEESKSELEHCIDHLNDNYKQIITLSYLKEINSEDICKEMNISPSNFWVIIHRAKLKLRKCLEALEK